jgi:5-methylcytosine-specific restriction endonuclease McrA
MELPVDYTKLHYTERRKVREEYIKRQKGLCCYCGVPLDGKPADNVACKKVTKRLFPENFFKWPVHLHHSHVTGMTIGAVHNHCNAVAWEYDGE